MALAKQIATEETLQALLDAFNGSGGSSGGEGLADIFLDWKAQQDTIGRETNNLLALIARALNEDASGKITSYSVILAYLRAGLISRILAVGDKLRVSKETGLSVTVSGTITGATVIENTFLAATGHAGTAAYEFVFDGAVWHLEDEAGNLRPVELATYGITPTGAPAAEDRIVVHEQASEIIFDVAGIDYDRPIAKDKTHSLTLITQDVQTYNTIPFSNPQALKAIAADEFPDGLPAGTYYITLDHGSYDNTTAQDGSYQLTITQPIPVGGKIRHSSIGKYQSGSYTKAQILAGTWTTYDASYNVIESGLATTEGTDGSYLGTATAETMSCMSGQHLNSTRRQAHGSSCAAHSAQRKWFNSSAAGAASGEVASWWTASNEFDMPVRSTLAGWLHGMDPDFVACLGKVRKRSFLSAWDNGGTASYADSEELVFRLSMTELGWGANSGVTETSPDEEGAVINAPYPLYEGATNADRTKYQGTTARYWWLRSPFPSYCNFVRLVYSSGSLYSYYHAYNTHGAVAGLNFI